MDRGGRGASSPDRLEGIVTGTIAPRFDEPTALEVVADDLWSLGLAPEATAMSLARPGSRPAGSSLLPPSSARRPNTSRSPASSRTASTETAHGAVFVNLEDETGHVNVIFSKGAWARWRHVAGAAPALVIRGRLERAQGALAVTAEHVAALELGAPVAASRDFR